MWPDSNVNRKFSQKTMCFFCMWRNSFFFLFSIENKSILATMLPSTKLFKTINCPFYEVDTESCNRPYCHFNHAKPGTYECVVVFCQYIPKSWMTLWICLSYCTESVWYIFRNTPRFIKTHCWPTNCSHLKTIDTCLHTNTKAHTWG